MQTPFFQYQEFTAPVSTQPERVSEDKWHQPWSEPVRFKRSKQAAIALAASGFVLVQFDFGEEILADKWFKSLSEPVRVKPNIGAARQPAFQTIDTRPIVSFGWYGNLHDPVRFRSFKTHLQRATTLDTEPFPAGHIPSWYARLSEPVRVKPRLIEANQRYFEPDWEPNVSFSYYNWLTDPVRLPKGLRAWYQQAVAYDAEIFPQPTDFMAWFNWYSEPVRFKAGLSARLQQTLAAPERHLPTANVTVTFAATDPSDSASFGIVLFGQPASAKVSIRESDPYGLGVSSLRESS